MEEEQEEEAEVEDLVHVRFEAHERNDLHGLYESHFIQNIDEKKHGNRATLTDTR